MASNNSTGTATQSTNGNFEYLMSLFDKYDTSKNEMKPLNKIEEEKKATPEAVGPASSSSSSAADYLKGLL